MPIIHLSTPIAAPLQRVFDLARSVEAHQESAAGTGERAVGGVTTGLLGLDDEITWEARHFGIKQRLTVRITGFDPPAQFQDTMVTGPFKSMRHDHQFIPQPPGTPGSPGSPGLPGTLMVDRFEFQSPYGVLGRIVDQLFLTAYMRRFLLRRNRVLKTLAETDAWRKYIVPQ